LLRAASSSPTVVTHRIVAPRCWGVAAVVDAGVNELDLWTAVLLLASVGIGWAALARRHT
jgi:hypothetical protein